MKPDRKLAETTTPNGAVLALFEHDGTYAIRLNGQTLMNSSATASELLLGRLAVDKLVDRETPQILIGGLGLGFTLKSVLANVGPKASVQVTELIPQVVDWNREFLAGLNGALLADPRVEVRVEDVRSVLGRSGENRYDAILLDIDNGPAAMVAKSNARLYDDRGIRVLLTTLKSGGRAAIWSAAPDRAFEGRLIEAGFRVEAIPALLHNRAKRFSSTIYLADKPSR